MVIPLFISKPLTLLISVNEGMIRYLPIIKECFPEWFFAYQFICLISLSVILDVDFTSTITFFIITGRIITNVFKYYEIGSVPVFTGVL